MLWFGKKRKNPESYAYRLEMAEKIVGHHVKYVTERKEDGIDEVIGRDGAMAIKNDELIVFASQDILFRTDISDLRVSELLSKDGVIVGGPDKEHNGSDRTLVVYYVYYRK